MPQITPGQGWEKVTPQRYWGLTWRSFRGMNPFLSQKKIKLSFWTCFYKILLPCLSLLLFCLELQIGVLFEPSPNSEPTRNSFNHCSQQSQLLLVRIYGCPYISKYPFMPFHFYGNLDSLFSTHRYLFGKNLIEEKSEFTDR